MNKKIQYNSKAITRKTFLQKMSIGALTISAGGLLLPKTVMGGVRDNLNDGELAKQVSTNTKNIADMKTNFQAGVDSVYDAVVAKGTTPASKSLSDVITGIRDIQGDVKTIMKNATVKVVDSTSGSSSYDSGKKAIDSSAFSITCVNANYVNDQSDSCSSCGETCNCADYPTARLCLYTSDDTDSTATVYWYSLSAGGTTIYLGDYSKTFAYYRLILTYGYKKHNCDNGCSGHTISNKKYYSNFTLEVNGLIYNT